MSNTRVTQYQAAKEAVQKPVGPLQEKVLAEQKQATRGPNAWSTLPDGRLLVPEALGRTLVAQLHQATHIGVTKTSELL